MGNVGTLLQAIDQIYEAAVDPAGLDRLALVLARVFDTESGFIAFNEIRKPLTPGAPAILGLPSATANFDGWARGAYAEYYHDRNIWHQAGIKRGLNHVVLGQELVDDKTLLRSEWYDYCQKLDAFHVLGALCQLSSNLAGQFGAHRSRRAAPFDEGDRAKMQQLLPHLQRALQVHTKLDLAERGRNFGMEVLSDLAAAVIVVSKDAKILFANQAAERMLESGTDLAITRGRLVPQNPEQKKTFERLVAGAAETSAGKGASSGALFTLTDQSGHPISILISPLRAGQSGFGPGLPAAVLIFSEPGAEAFPKGAEQALGSAYNLTRAEARLAAALAAGETLSEYAGRSGVSLNTAKTQLRQAFAKIGCSRQADLVRMLYANSAVRLALVQSR
jgi:DNA-binding CsgD family transcriptional regulator/PAS domain-containing protein